MVQTKNLCAQIPTTLHEQVCEAREQLGLTTAQYITNLLIEYYEMKKNGGNTTMANGKNRTLAFQIDETLFQRIKVHLDRETVRTGRKLTQREFVLGLIEEALEAAERQSGRPERPAWSRKMRLSPTQGPMLALVRPRRETRTPPVKPVAAPVGPRRTEASPRT